MLYSYLFLFAKGDFTLHSKHRYSSTSSSILHLSITKLLRTIPQHCPSIPFSTLALRNATMRHHSTTALCRAVPLLCFSLPRNIMLCLCKPSISALIHGYALMNFTLRFSTIPSHCLAQLCTFIIYNCICKILQS